MLKGILVATYMAIPFVILGWVLWREQRALQRQREANKQKLDELHQEAEQVLEKMRHG
jgi:cell division protein FtsB